ncbi:MAG: hypothetical protein AAGA54_37100 [Myxococcota bacterium]
MTPRSAIFVALTLSAACQRGVTQPSEPLEEAKTEVVIAPEPSRKVVTPEAPQQAETTPSLPEPFLAVFDARPMDPPLEFSEQPEMQRAARAAVREAADRVSSGDVSAVLDLGRDEAARAIGARVRSAATLNDLIHPQIGMFVVYNPGALGLLLRERRWDGMGPASAYLYGPEVLTVLQDPAALPSTRASKGVDEECGEEPEAFVATSERIFESWNVVISPYDVGFTRVMLESYEAHATGMEPLSREDFEAAQRAGLFTTYSAYVLDSQFDFGRIDGTWYLLGVDATDC